MAKFSIVPKVKKPALRKVAPGQITFVIGEELYARAVAAAAKNGTSLSGLIRQMVIHCLKDIE